jgi:hypothetical protein
VTRRSYDEYHIAPHSAAPSTLTGAARFSLPDPGDMPTVIAQDLSNLPPAESALDPETGEEFTMAQRRVSIAAITAVAQHRSAFAAARA